MIINYKENKKAFTLIELLTVIAILGILVLLAAPKFLGYTTQAKETQAKADIKTFETAIAAKLSLDEDLNSSWPTVEVTKLEEYRDSNSLFTLEGRVKEDYQFNGSYIDIPEEDFKGEVKSKLSGDFIMDLGGKIYYHDETLAGNLDNSSPNVVVEDEVRPDGITILKDGSGVKLANGDFIPAVTEADFTLGAKVAGYYSYTGTENKIYIPSDLKLGGNLITDASYMFNGSSVEKVVLLENNITNMKSMFSNAKATSLDLSSFDTSKVTDMRSMFDGSGSKATSLDLSSFDTKNVTDMSFMFSGSKATTLDLSSFDTSNVTTMNFMFERSQATTGYAKTQADANKLNGSYKKPDTLSFTTE